MIGRWTVLNGVLLAIVVLLGLQIGWTWMQAVPPLRMPAAGTADPSHRRDVKGKPAPERGEQSEDAVAVITSMDLFDVSRQAVGADGTTAAAEVPPPTGIEVVGIRMLGGDEEALIRDASQQNAQRRVRTGDEVAGYTVQAIRPTNIELANATGQSVTLWLQLAPSTAQKPAAPGGRPAAVPPATVRTSTSAGRQMATPPPLNPKQAERERLRQQRLQRQRGGAALQPSLPAGVRQLRDEMRKGV